MHTRYTGVAAAASAAAVCARASRITIEHVIIIYVTRPCVRRSVCDIYNIRRI